MRGQWIKCKSQIANLERVNYIKIKDQEKEIVFYYDGDEISWFIFSNQQEYDNAVSNIIAITKPRIL